MNIPKFRAWHMANKKMSSVLALNILDDQLAVKLEIVEVGGMDFEDPFWEDISDYILMQSTGLFDKNGVEIFEGDIIDNSGEVQYGKYREEMDSSFATPLMSHEHIGFYCLLRDGQQFHIGKWVLNRLITGNIFEHHELLKDEIR